MFNLYALNSVYSLHAGCTKLGASEWSQDEGLSRVLKLHTWVVSENTYVVEWDAVTSAVQTGSQQTLKSTTPRPSKRRVCSYTSPGTCPLREVEAFDHITMDICHDRYYINWSNDQRCGVATLVVIRSTGTRLGTQTSCRARALRGATFFTVL